MRGRRGGVRIVIRWLCRRSCMRLCGIRVCLTMLIFGLRMGHSLLCIVLGIAPASPNTATTSSAGKATPSNAPWTPAAQATPAPSSRCRVPRRRSNVGCRGLWMRRWMGGCRNCREGVRFGEEGVRRGFEADVGVGGKQSTVEKVWTVNNVDFLDSITHEIPSRPTQSLSQHPRLPYQAQRRKFHPAHAGDLKSQTRTYPYTPQSLTLYSNQSCTLLPTPDAKTQHRCMHNVYPGSLHIYLQCRIPCKEAGLCFPVHCVYRIDGIGCILWFQWRRFMAV